MSNNLKGSIILAITAATFRKDGMSFLAITTVLFPVECLVRAKAMRCRGLGTLAYRYLQVQQNSQQRQCAGGDSSVVLKESSPAVHSTCMQRTVIEESSGHANGGPTLSDSDKMNSISTRNKFLRSELRSRRLKLFS